MKLLQILKNCLEGATYWQEVQKCLAVILLNLEPMEFNEDCYDEKIKKAKKLSIRYHVRARSTKMPSSYILMTHKIIIMRNSQSGLNWLNNI